MSRIDDPAVTTPRISPWLARAAFATPTLPPATKTNSYVVGTSHALLVEPASPYEQDELRSWVHSTGATICALVPTHHHIDHVGALEYLRDSLGVPVWAHRETAKRLDVTVERVLEDGDVIDVGGGVELEVLHTPGHAPGHVCLFERTTRSLIAGDMVASVGTILVEPNDGDMSLYLESLARLRDLDANTVYPAHGDPITPGREIFERYIAHRLAREAKILAALQSLQALDRTSATTIAQIVPIAYSDTPPASWPLASLSTAAHLEKLAGEGSVDRTGIQWWARSRP